MENVGASKVQADLGQKDLKGPFNSLVQCIIEFDQFVKSITEKNQ